MRWNNLSGSHNVMPKTDDLHCIFGSLYFPSIRWNIRLSPSSQVLLSKWMEYSFRNILDHHSSVLPYLYGMLSKIIRTLLNIHASCNKIPQINPNSVCIHSFVLDTHLWINCPHNLAVCSIRYPIRTSLLERKSI